MKITDLNANWNIAVGDTAHFRDLPFDVIKSAVDFIDIEEHIVPTQATFVKTLPSVRANKALVVFRGTCGCGDVFLNDELIGAVRSYAPCVFDITDKLSGTHNTLRVELTSVPEMSKQYIGMGIAGGAELVTFSSLDFEYDSLFVKTNASGGRVYADTQVTVRNDGDAAKFVLECAATNARGKRCGKKQRKIFMRAHTVKTFTVRVRLTKTYEWTTSDPYMYRMTARILSENGESECASRFGIVNRALNALRGLYLNNKNTLLFGAYVPRADGVLGGVSLYSSEKRRFGALKALGYNAVHFVECPTEAALDALDDLGMYAYVDLFDCLIEGKSPLDGHMFFDGGERAAEIAVCALRNHPSVALYGIADNVVECYNRHGGHTVIARLAETVKRADGTRPVTVSASEFVPTAKELEAVGIKRHMDTPAAAINAGREKDMFEELTAGAFESVDVCGFNYLYPLYETERLKRNRLIVGSRTSNDRAFDSLDETEKNNRVIGDFNDCGIDYPLSDGGTATGGDLDILLDEKPQAAYKRILLGARNVAYITVLDPVTEEPTHMWNWPRHLGQSVSVRVYTSGDVVALYLDGRLIGRKLAGKVNRHIAAFETEYYPGTLQAVCYFKGVECARTTLRSAGSPKVIKLDAYEKNLSLSRGDVGFVHIDVCDRDGNLVPYAMRQLGVQATGAQLVGFVNADPELRKNSFDSCPAYGGRAIAVIKPDAVGKAVVKITGDGLLSSKITFKVKD